MEESVTVILCPYSDFQCYNHDIMIKHTRSTVFTWLNAAATIRHVLKIDAATIQRRPLFEGGVYYTLST